MKKKTDTDRFNDSAIDELHFANMQVAHLLSVLNEVKTISGDFLTQEVVRNGLDRHELDKLIHAKIILFS